MGFLRTLIMAGLCVALGLLRASALAQESDVLVYGGTPGGIAAAVSAAKAGRSVVLVEPTARVGGLVTSGLSHPDFHSFESLSGAFLDFSRRVEAHYARTYGQDSPQVRDSFRGTSAEPKVNLLVFEAMLTEHPRLTVRKHFVLDSVNVVGAGDGRTIQSAGFVGADGRPSRCGRACSSTRRMKAT